MHKAHAKYSPSASHRWLRCTGSVHLTKDIQEKQTLYSLQGQVAHFLAERCLLNPNLDPLTFIGTTFTDVGDYELTEEDVLAVNKYVILMREEINLAGKNAKVMIEKAFKSTALDPNLFGTSDAVIITEDGVLKIYDYKHGAGVLVSVKDNYQMYCYALLALSYAKENNINITNIEIIIVQPRASDDYISREFISFETLKNFRDLVLDKIEEIEDTENSPILTVGEKQCRWCPIKHICPEVMKKNLAIAKAEFSDNKLTLPSPELLTEQELIKILDHADFFRSWLTSVENFMEAQALSGKKIDGWKLVSKRAFRKWENEELTINYLKEMLPESQSEFFTKPSLKSPAQIENLIKSQKEPKDIILMKLSQLQQFIYMPNTAPTLVKESDKRSEIQPYLTAQEEFN